MKKIILFSMFLLFGLFVSAYSENDTITQEQLNSIDTSTINLDCIDEGYTLDIFRLTYTYSCLDIKKNGKDYIIFRNKGESSFKIYTIWYMINRDGAETTITRIKTSVLNDFRSFRNTIRYYIEQKQTKDLSAYDWAIDLDTI